MSKTWAQAVRETVKMISSYFTFPKFATTLKVIKEFFSIIGFWLWPTIVSVFIVDYFNIAASSIFAVVLLIMDVVWCLFAVFVIFRKYDL